MWNQRTEATTCIVPASLPRRVLIQARVLRIQGLRLVVEKSGLPTLEIRTISLVTPQAWSNVRPPQRAGGTVTVVGGDKRTHKVECLTNSP